MFYKSHCKDSRLLFRCQWLTPVGQFAVVRSFCEPLNSVGGFSALLTNTHSLQFSASVAIKAFDVCKHAQNRFNSKLMQISLDLFSDLEFLSCLKSELQSQ